MASVPSSRRAPSSKRRQKSGLWSNIQLIFAALVLAVVLVIFIHISALSDPLDAVSFVKSQDTFATPKASAAAVEPFDLSVNHLQRIIKANGAFPEQVAGAPEDFLPVVVSDNVELRFRLRGRTGASPSSMRDIGSYQIEAKHAHSDKLVLWDSGKVSVDGAPRSISWGGDRLHVGTIVRWRVSVWDSNGFGPSTSEWTKFAVGPTDGEWKGKWITHPDDMTKFNNGLLGIGVKKQECEDWKSRRPLPVARARLQLSSEEKKKEIVSALLVVSGLGSFSTSLDGMDLSSSSPLDPPMLDYTQRVFYRGFDVTSHFADGKGDSAHVVGITLGSGWWDGRPLQGGIVKFALLPRGPLTTVAELHLTFSDGTTTVKIPSETNGENWQVAKGFIRDSDLFTGETVDLDVLNEMKGWNSPSGWSAVGASKGKSVVWMNPSLYKSDTTLKEWRQALAQRAGALPRGEKPKFKIAPIGKLVPGEAPPVLPIERIAPESVVDLGNGRWLFDFGKGFSGVLRFNSGLPPPFVPKDGYPRGHFVEGENEEFITVVYGDSLAMETGDINLVIVAGMGLHRNTPEEAQGAGGSCFPKDHGNILTQRDVFISPKKGSGSFGDARQPLFTSHAFRFAEVCCTKTPPTNNVYALAYRTAFAEWGKFDSSNVRLNGAYELTRNALNSNMLGTQTDCPHRERLQYGGDLNSDSPAALHFFDLGAFYGKVIRDWKDTQWESNGAYTETSIWQDLNDYAGIGHGAGETVWASAPPVLTVRHSQHYGDTKLMSEMFNHHVQWVDFLKEKFDEGMQQKFGNKGKNLEDYHGSDGGLGDWLSVHQRDVWLTHHAFCMAAARSVAYLAEKLGDKSLAEAGASAMAYANEIKDKIVSIYMQRDNFRTKHNWDFTPGPDLGLFARIVPGPKRCTVLKEWIRYQGSGHPQLWWGDEEQRFFRHLNQPDLEEVMKLGQVRKEAKNKKGEQVFSIVRKHRRHTSEGIFAIRYALKTLSDMGFHNIALSKANGEGYPSYEYMLSHNATTLWETWWRSEDVYSRNHPMLGAVAEWLPSSVAGVSLAPTTVAGEELLFWPRIPTSAQVVQFASATQGTKRGDASIAWAFVGLPKDKRLYDSATVEVHIRVLVPPASKATLRLPSNALGGKCVLKYARTLPDMEAAKASAAEKCNMRRMAGKGFDYNWEYDNDKEEWNKRHVGKAIGTPCKSYLFDSKLRETRWSAPDSVITEGGAKGEDFELELEPGFYDVTMEKWQLVKEIEDVPGYDEYAGEIDLYCSDHSTYEWDIQDATHII